MRLDGPLGAPARGLSLLARGLLRIPQAAGVPEWREEEVYNFLLQFYGAPEAGDAPGSMVQLIQRLSAPSDASAQAPLPEAALHPGAVRWEKVLPGLSVAQGSRAEEVRHCLPRAAVSCLKYSDDHD